MHGAGKIRHCLLMSIMAFSPACRGLLLAALVLVWMPLPGFGAVSPPVLATVVTVVGLDEQGNPGPQGLGVITGKGKQVLTSASLFAAQAAGVIKTGKGEMCLIREISGLDPASDLAVAQSEAKCGSPVQVAGNRREVEG